MAKQPNKTRTSAKNTPRPAGSRTVVRREEREKERRRQRLITGSIVAAALVAVAVFIIVIVNAPADATVPEGALTRYEGVQQTRTTEGFPRLGSPDAPIQLAEFSSFDCPHCREFHAAAIDQLVDRVRTGYVAVTYVPLYGFGSVTNGQGAAEASICAAEQSKFWSFHDGLFEWQGLYGNQAFTNNRINAGVDAFALDRGAFNACMSSSRPDDVLNAARAYQQRFGVTATPTFTINGVIPLDSDQQSINTPEGIIARLDAEIARIGRLPATQEASVETPAEATSEATVEAAEPTDEPVGEATEAAVTATDEAAATPEATAAS